MSTRLEVGHHVDADLDAVWAVLVDWVGQERWIPLTTVQVHSAEDRGRGVRVAALSGFWLGRVPVGLLDNFVVTGWSPPHEAEGGARAELAVLHLGPYFTGEGVFQLSTDGAGTRVQATELFDVPGGALANRLVGLALPLMRVGFGASLAQLAAVVEGRRG